MFIHSGGSLGKDKLERISWGKKKGRRKNKRRNMRGGRSDIEGNKYRDGSSGTTSKQNMKRTDRSTDGYDPWNPNLLLIRLGLT